MKLVFSIMIISTIVAHIATGPIKPAKENVKSNENQFIGNVLPESNHFNTGLQRQMFNRKKRSSFIGMQIQLNAPLYKQQKAYTCGPSIAISLFRHIGIQQFAAINIQNAANWEYQILENTIGFRMSTTPFPGGTSPQNWMNAVNQYLGEHGFSQRFSLISFDPPRYVENSLNGNENEYRRNFFRNINEIVRNSLANNIPVAFAHSYQPSYREAGFGRHFVLIDGIGPNRAYPGSIRYRFMDPATGEYNTLTAEDMYYRGGDHFHFIYFDAPSRSDVEMVDAVDCTIGGGATTGAAIHGSVGALAGAGAGALAGSAVPSIGTAIGALVGGVLGGLSAASQGALEGTVINAIRGCS